ncbi:HET-domain-containing protein, partial [Plenodomus tracheiphilus IPT5]
CESCRRDKVKCIPADTSDQDQRCKRCLDRKLECFRYQTASLHRPKRPLSEDDHSLRNTIQFMLPSAKGDLFKYWKEIEPTPQLNHKNIAWIANQCMGIADALSRLHACPARISTASSHARDTENDDYRANYRHGNISPDSILWFDENLEESSTLRGCLQISNFWSAELISPRGGHRDYTHSMTYRPPECDYTTSIIDQSDDIWCLGCVYLEFLTWALGGAKLLVEFARRRLSKNDLSPIRMDRFYQILQGELNKPAAVVKPAVLECIDELHTHPSCTDYIHEFLTLIQYDMLVIEPKNRMTSKQIKDRLVSLQSRYAGDEKRAEQRTPWSLGSMRTARSSQSIWHDTECPRTDNSPPPEPASPSEVTGTLVSPEYDWKLSRDTEQESPSEQPYISEFSDDYLAPSHEDWEFPVDNAFAENVLAEVGPQPFHPTSRGFSDLCDRCAHLNFWAAGFTFEDTLANLARKSEVCHFCRMLFRLIEKTKEISEAELVTVERKQSSLMLSGRSTPLMTIMRSPELSTPIPIQLGFPQLPPLNILTGSLIRLWLDDCHKNHTDCQVSKSNSVRLPTRLIDVGSDGSDTLRLVDTHRDRITQGNYIALSHIWGASPSSCSTRRENLGQFMTSIPEEMLPSQIKDAVRVARALGVRYLWVDIICIINDDHGDWASEMKRFDEVFRGALFVLAATRSTGLDHSFLESRSRREFVTFDGGARLPFYICEAVDDFERDVIEAPMNQRAWILQERAFATKTVHFAEAQTYFECGHGIRCETLVKMENHLSEILGDPDFPNKAISPPSRGSSIQFIQKLYSQYSRLQLPMMVDRPMAIFTLEQKVLQALNTTGGFGIFGDDLKGGFFHRSLLWRRGEVETYMTPINFDRTRQVPSWSWMAYAGGIGYITPPFGEVDWEREEIQSPWRNLKGYDARQDLNSKSALTAVARRFDVRGRKPNDVKLVYDAENPRGVAGEKAQCVIIARSKEGLLQHEKMFYVLLIVFTGELGADGEREYIRVGAGTMLGKYISWDEPSTPVKIY